MDSCKCPITQEIFEDPVVGDDGQTYERKAITEWLTKHGTSPMTRQPMNINSLKTNYTVKQIIEELRPRSQSQPSQCSHQLRTMPNEGWQQDPQNRSAFKTLKESLSNFGTESIDTRQQTPSSHVNRIPERPLIEKSVTPDNIVYIPCEYCNELIDLSAWSIHTATCRDEEQIRLENQARILSQQYITPQIPCDYCQKLMLADELHTHEVGCKKNPNNKAPTAHKNRRYSESSRHNVQTKRTSNSLSRNNPSPFQGGNTFDQTLYPPLSGAHQSSSPSSRYSQTFSGSLQPRLSSSSANTGPYQSQHAVYSPNNPEQQSYQNPYLYQPSGGGYNGNIHGTTANFVSDRLRAITRRYEISEMLAQRLHILQQFEVVVLCDDSGSMNTPVDSIGATRWNGLRAIVEIVIEIGTVFNSNGVNLHFLNRSPIPNVTVSQQVIDSFSQLPGGSTPLTASLRRIFQLSASKPVCDKRLLVLVATDGAPTDSNGNVDIPSLENLMRNERQTNTTYVTFLACTDDEPSVEYFSQWNRTMQNVDVVYDYKTEREKIRRKRGYNHPFSFGDYVVKALVGIVDRQTDAF